jgi:hypothetical protein
MRKRAIVQLQSYAALVANRGEKRLLRGEVSSPRVGIDACKESHPA